MCAVCRSACNVTLRCLYKNKIYNQMKSLIIACNFVTGYPSSFKSTLCLSWNNTTSINAALNSLLSSSKCTNKYGFLPCLIFSTEMEMDMPFPSVQRIFHFYPYKMKDVQKLHTANSEILKIILPNSFLNGSLLHGYVTFCTVRPFLHRYSN